MLRYSTIDTFESCACAHMLYSVPIPITDFEKPFPWYSCNEVWAQYPSVISHSYGKSASCSQNHRTPGTIFDGYLGLQGKLWKMLPSLGTTSTWRLPELGLPPVIIHFWHFPFINNQFWVVPPMTMETPTEKLQTEESPPDSSPPSQLRALQPRLKHVGTWENWMISMKFPRG